MNTQARGAFTLLLGLALVGGCEKKHDHAEHPHGADGDGHGHEHGGGHGHGEGGEHHHHDKDMRPSLKSFHDVLAPVYHADKGPGRTDKACADAPAMSKAAAGVVADEGTGDVPSRKDRNEALTKSVADLEAACQGDKSGVDAALEEVHEAFHAFLEKK